MRYVYLSALVAFLVSIPSVSNGQNATQSITNYQLVSEERISSTLSNLTYRADLINPGAAGAAVTATVRSVSPDVSIVPGHGNLHFSPAPANSSVGSSNAFALLVKAGTTFDPSDLVWSFTAPVANAGPGQTASIGSKITVDGSGSTNPSGFGTLHYSWAFASLPAGSNARLENATSAMPSFVVDVPGNYTLTLTVENGRDTDSDSITISTTNTPPVADAGFNQTLAVGTTVVLDGSGSSDVDGNALTHSWTLVTKPAGSNATLSGATTVSPTFVIDKPGMYVAQLVVNDGVVDSTPSAVAITTQNTPPVANAGAAQVVTAGALVQLNGAGSTDVDGNPLTYSWNLITLPNGSQAALSNPAAVNPTFTADVAGTYVAQLTVNDGFVNGTPATVAITTNSVQAPTANAGPNQTVTHNSTVALSGSGIDPQGLPLSYQLALITKPAGSNAALSNTGIANPTFAADRPGTYVVQLIANNGVLSSPPATVTITTTNTPPVANAGPMQNVRVGANVQLDGSGSSDADHDPLTTSWSLLSRPDGSTATLFSPTGKSPMFVADIAGTYVVQLIVNDGYTNSKPTTVTINASAAPAITLLPNRLNLGRAHGTLTVGLSAPAGEGGQVVNLSVSDSSIASVPESVTIPQGSTGVNITVPRGTRSGSATITASAASFLSGTAKVNAVGSNEIILPANIAVAPGQKVAFPVTLSSAPASSVFVTLAVSDTTKLTISSTSIIFAAGSTTPSSTPQITGVALGSATITASATNFATVTDTIQVAPNISFSPATLSVPGFVNKNLNLVLSSAAPVGGQVINLSSSNPSVASVPATVTIAANTTTVSVPVTGIGFGTATIDANALPTLLDTYATVNVVSAGTVNVPASASVGNLQTVAFPISLSTAAPTGGVTVSLSSSDTTTLTISPATVTIPAGSTSPAAQPTITGVVVGSATITASAPGYTTSSLLVPVNNVQIGLPSSASVGLGTSTAFPVTLVTPAPAGGLTVTLSSSDKTKVTVTSSVTIAAGALTPTTQPQITGVNLGSANITASAPGYISATQPVSVNATVSYTPATISVAATATTSVTLTLSAAAPTGGVTVNLSSNNPSIATVPATVTFAAGSKTATFVVTGVAAGSGAMIDASLSPNIVDTYANVTVTPPGTIGMPSGLSVGLTQSASFPITLSTPAPTGGVTVNLASSNSSIVSISTASVQIAAGATAPTTQPQVTGVNVGTVNITASAPGYTTATQSVNGTATVNFALSSETIGLNSTQNLTLNLSANAPTGGLTVNLSSTNPAIANVPSTVTFTAGTKSVLVPVTGMANIGSATIQASGTNIAAATTAVTVAQLPSITLPANLTVSLNKTAPLSITLQTAAPSGGVTVALVSSNTSAATVSPVNVFIAGGAVSPATAPTVTGLNFASVSISATATGYAAASVPVLVNTTATLSPTSAAIIGTNTSTFTITLGATAPNGGIAIGLLSGDPSVATVPATVNVTGTSATFAVTGVAPGTTTISASALPYINNVTPVNVTVNPLGTITFLPGSPGLTQTAPLSITISPVAPAGGVTVTLKSSNTSIATVPATVTIPAGSSSPATNPNVTGVNLGQATLTASAANYTATTQPIQVTATLTAFTPSTATIYGTGTQTYSLTLSGTAPTGGVTVNLNSNTPGVATVPATVTIPAGSKTATFVATGVAAGQTTITAGSTYIPTVSATLTDANPGTISIDPVSVGKGQGAQFQIFLSPAPPVNTTVTLSSSNTSIATISPTSVTVVAGSNLPPTQPTVTGTNFGSATITASAYGYVTASQVVPVSDSIAFSSPTLTINGSGTQNLTLTLSAPAPVGGFVINLSSSNTSIATVQSTVTIPQGSTSVNVPVTAGGQNFGTTTITASQSPNIAAATATVTVQSAGTIVVTPVTVALGAPAAFNVFLPASAPSSVTVTLSSSNTSMATISPTSVTIPSGQLSPATQPKVTALNLGSANITASAIGYATNVQPATLMASVSYAPTSLTIVGGAGTGTFTLTLSGTAPTGGLTVNLSSSDTTIATVPATATFAVGSKTATVTVTGVAAGTAIIHASNDAGIADTTASVTVTPPGTITLTPNVTTGLAQAQSLSLTLNPPAPTGGTKVTLSSSNTSIATVTGSTTVAATGTTANYTVTGGSSFGSATITASAQGYVTTTQAIQVADTISFSTPTLTITGPKTGTLTLTLSAKAPSAGLTVNLSSSNTSVATVPATATFTSGSTTASVIVTGLNIGSTTITASQLPNVPATTAAVTVLTGGNFVMPGVPSVLLGGTANYQVSIPITAPTGGVTVTLTSSNPAVVSVPASFVIPAGATTASVPPKITGVGIGSATITASAPGFTTTTSQAISGNTTVTLTSTLSITGPKTANITATLAQPAPAGGLTINVSSSNTLVATVPATVTFNASSNTALIPVTATGAGSATISASLLPNIPSATSTVTVISQGLIVIPSNVSVQMGQSSSYNVSLQAAAPTGGINVNLSSSDPTKVTISPSSVFIAAGATTPATQPQITGANIGSVTITASSPVYTSANQTVSVDTTVVPSPTNISITGIGSQNLTLTLPLNAPAAGVTINLSSSNTSVATVPATATIPGGSNSVTVPVNSVNIGTAVITAGVTVGSNTYIPAVTANVTVLSAGTFSLGPAISVMDGQSGTLAVSVSPAATNGVTVYLASSNTSMATVTPASVFIPAGATTPTTQPQVNAINVGSVTITATAPGFTAATPIAATLTNTVSFPSGLTTIQIPAKSTQLIQNITLTLGVAVPTALSVNLSSSNPNVASVATTVTFPANTTSVQVPVTGIAGTGGTVTIQASKSPYIAAATANVYVKNPPLGTLTIAPVSVGQGLEQQIFINLSTPQSTDVDVQILSSDPTKMLLAGRVGDPGSPSIMASIAAGTTSAGGIYVQGLVPSGTVSVYTQTTNYVDANATVTLQPSGFVLSGPNGIGNSSMIVFQGSQTPLTVSSAMLDSSFKFVAVQPVANGVNPSVNVTSTNTSIGTIATSPLTFGAGVSTATTMFNAASTGSSSSASVTVNVGPAAGFSTPANDTSLTATVDAASMTAGNVTVGNGLEATAQVTLNGVAPAATVVTISSTSNSVKFSTTSNGTGASSIQLTIPTGYSYTAPFYIYGLANSGSAQYTADATAYGFGKTTGTITFQPSGIVMQGPLGLGATAFSTPINSTQGISVYSAMLNSSGGYVAQQPVAGPNGVSVNLSSSNHTVGTIDTSVTIAGGTSSASATFNALAAGTTSLTLTEPGAPFSTPSADTQINATVAAPSVSITTGVKVGNQLAAQGTVSLSQAPTGSTTVTLTIGANSNILLAVHPTDAGSASIQVPISAGNTTANYYIYGLSNSGTATYSATASGYSGANASVTLAPSGVVLAGPSGLGLLGFTTSVGSPVTLTVYTGALDVSNSNHFLVQEQLAGFVTGVSVTLNDSSGGAYGSFTPDPVSIAAGASSNTITFNPTVDSGGTFFLSITTPNGFTTSGNDTSLQASVNN